MEKVAERVSCAVVAGVIGLIISFSLLFLTDSPALVMFIVIPVGCGVAGFVAGDKAVEVFKDIAKWI